jgi:hypothetical protein
MNMARFIDQNQGDYTKEQYRQMAAYYGTVIGLLISKTGPIEITTDDIWCYQVAKVKPVMDAGPDRDGIKVFLLGEDEWPDSDTVPDDFAM